MEEWFRWQDDVLTLNLHLQPGAKKDEMTGPCGAVLKIRISAPPVNGKANAYLIKFLSTQFGVRQRQIQLLSGDSHRHKRVAISSPKKFPSPWFDQLINT